MLCKNCGKELGHGWAFCGHCGASAEVKKDTPPSPLDISVGMFCGNCGAKNDAGSMFCGECGERLTSTPPTSTTVVTDIPPRDTVSREIKSIIKGTDKTPLHTSPDTEKMGEFFSKAGDIDL